VRICRDKSDLEKRLKELENMLLSRKYNKSQKQDMPCKTTIDRKTPNKAGNRHKTVQQTLWYLPICVAIQRLYINNNKRKVCYERNLHMHNKRHNIPYNLL
jgi:hypothetical protein